VTMKTFAFGLFVVLAIASPALADSSAPLFHGVAQDCASDNFGGHMPKGFACRGTGTGVGICAKADDPRLVSYDVQIGYCHLDWISATRARVKQTLQYLNCDGSNPECANAAFVKRTDQLAPIECSSAGCCAQLTEDQYFCGVPKKGNVFK
jgi:hypothetical protein